LIGFTRYTYPLYIAEPAHYHIARRLEQVLRGEIKRLMIFSPPQHGKSELISIRFPAYWLAQRPDDPVILASYGASLAERHSSEARATVESTGYHDLWPGIETRKDSRSKQLWRIAGRRGGLLSVGVGGPITGHGAQLGIIDDPFENWRQAQSATTRDHVWNWWRGTFRTRIWEGGAIILVMTRWHEDDLAGRLLATQGEEWTVLRLPALAESQKERDANNELLGLAPGLDDPLGREPGAALCPRRFSRAALLEIKRDVGSMVWHAEYQGTPRAPEGNKFKRGWFAGKFVNEVPAAAKRVRFWDKAGTQGGGDYTVGVLMAVHEGRYYVEDVVRGQWSDYEREKTMRATAEADGVEVEIAYEVEGGSGGKDSAAATARNLAGFVVSAERPTGDKATRATPFAAQCEAGNVLIKRAPWNGAYIAELCAFPNGANDDQVDASSGGFNKLARPNSGAAYLAWMKEKVGDRGDEHSSRSLQD
jgi:predicted phage terminase large subunit-like protein